MIQFISASVLLIFSFLIFVGLGNLYEGRKYDAPALLVSYFAMIVGLISIIAFAKLAFFGAQFGYAPAPR